MMKKGEVYKDFTVLDVVSIDDCASKGIWLKHNRTGLEVFHILNNDEENLFAFSFCTPAQDNMGTAHVLEHSVLCGSQKYPIKDPFIRLANQSVNTYLNAYTASDRTVFLASSTVKADFLNLFSVYADAVFFPLLKPEIFLQECHRLELDKNGKPSIQGVVYNEMKGNYSSFENIASEICSNVLFSDTNYAFDSGGDPLEIPKLTLSKLRAFHKKYYCPANCRLFLYGNIPTREQLDLLDKEVLYRIRNAGSKAVIPLRKKENSVKEFVRAFGPADENSKDAKSLVTLVWQTGDGTEDRSSFSVKNMFLAELLWGDDCAPVSKALLESGLGEEIAPQSGCSCSRLYSQLSCGLRGVEVKNAKRVQKVILKTLEDLCKNGIPSEDIERTCMSFDFSNREIKRLSGPYSIVLLNRCLRGWIYGAKPWETLFFRSEFEKIRDDLNNDQNYIPFLIDSLLLQNKKRTLVCVTPSASWNNRRTAQEKKTAKEILSRQTKQKVLKDSEKLRTFQNSIPSESENELIPRLKVSDLSLHFEKISTKTTEIQGIPVFVNTEPTAGILYVDVAFAADTLPPALYPHLPCLCECVSQVGWGGQNWAFVQTEIQRVTGGFGAYTCTARVPDCVSEEVRQKNYVGRDWVIFHFKVLEEFSSRAFDLLSDCLNGTDFSDTARLRDLLLGQYNAFQSYLVPYASLFASSRASCKINKNRAVTEIWEGLSAYFTVQKNVSDSVEVVARRLKNIFARLKKGGAVIHLTGTQNGIKNAKKLLPSFIKNVSLIPPQKAYGFSDVDFFALTELPFEEKAEKSFQNENPFSPQEIIVIPGTVGFAAAAFPASPFDSRECIADGVFSHWLTTTELWQKIRMEGGAYGVSLSNNSDSNFMRFYSERDPKPFETITALSSLLFEISTRHFSFAEVEKAITGCYSDEVYPQTPSSRGTTGFYWTLYGLNNAYKARRLKWLVSLKEKDLVLTAKRMAQNVENMRAIVIVGNEMEIAKKLENSGKIIRVQV